MTCENCNRWSYIEDDDILTCWNAQDGEGRQLSFQSFDEMEYWGDSNCERTGVQKD